VGTGGGNALLKPRGEEELGTTSFSLPSLDPFFFRLETARTTTSSVPSTNGSNSSTLSLLRLDGQEMTAAKVNDG
jgi:hypothetical protein